MGKQKKERKLKAKDNKAEFSEELSDGGERNKMAKMQAKRSK